MHENGIIILSSSKLAISKAISQSLLLAHENTVELFIERVQCIQFVRIKCNVNNVVKSTFSYNVCVGFLSWPLFI